MGIANLLVYEFGSVGYERSECRSPEARKS